MKNTRQQIGHHVRSARKEKGLSLYALAKQAGVKIDALQSVEAGNKAYTIDTLIKVHEALGMAFVAIPDALLSADRK